MSPNIDERIKQHLTASEWREILDEHEETVFEYFDELRQQETITPDQVEAFIILFPLVISTDRHKQWVRILYDVFSLAQQATDDDGIKQLDHHELGKAINRGLKRARKHIPLQLTFEQYADLFAYYLCEGGEHNAEIVLSAYTLAHLINNQHTYIRLYTQLAKAYLQWGIADKARDTALAAWELSLLVQSRKSKGYLPLVIEAYEQLGETELAERYRNLA